MLRMLTGRGRHRGFTEIIAIITRSVVFGVRANLCSDIRSFAEKGYAGQTEKQSGQKLLATINIIIAQASRRRRVGHRTASQERQPKAGRGWIPMPK